MIIFHSKYYHNSPSYELETITKVWHKREAFIAQKEIPQKSESFPLLQGFHRDFLSHNDGWFNLVLLPQFYRCISDRLTYFSQVTPSVIIGPEARKKKSFDCEPSDFLLLINSSKTKSYSFAFSIQKKVRNFPLMLMLISIRSNVYINGLGF